MFTQRLILAYQELIDYLAEKTSPEEILAFRVSATLQQRMNELSDKNKAGSITAEEKLELEQLLEFDLMMMSLKARALRARK